MVMGRLVVTARSLFAVAGIALLSAAFVPVAGTGVAGAAESPELRQQQKQEVATGIKTYRINIRRLQ